MKDYHSSHRVKYEIETDRCGWTSISVLDFLKGHN